LGSEWYTMAQADTRNYWDDLPYENWTYWFPHQLPNWDSDTMSVYYKVSGAIKPARFHAGRWQYRVNQGTWKNCGMKKNLILRTYKQQVVQNTIVVEGGEEDSHRCNICLEDVQFPMSNGCCSFKFCKDCYDMMPPEQKRICSGCRAPTPFTLAGGGDIYNGRNIRGWYNLYTELEPRVEAVQRALEERITEYQDNLMEANTRNEELLEQVETHKSDIDFYKFELKNTKHFLEEARSANVNERKALLLKNKKLMCEKRDKIDELEKNVTKYQMMYNKVIRMSIMLMVMLVFSVLR
jgi:hypothetical protein